MVVIGKTWDSFWRIGKREVVTDRVGCALIGVGSFIAFTALGAFVRIPLPFTPVPITLQTFFVLLAGALLGKRLGTLSQLGYVLLGGLGLPIFAGATGGLILLFGPTGGYFLGFILAAYVVGRVLSIKEKANFGWVVLAMAVGSLIIYLLGAIHLALFAHLGVKKALLLGVFPFIPGDILKLLAASSLYCKLQERAGQIFPR